jgi:hypothetical protein
LHSFDWSWAQVAIPNVCCRDPITRINLLSMLLYLHPEYF